MEVAAGVELSTEPMKPLPLQIFGGTPVGPELSRDICRMRSWIRCPGNFSPRESI